MVNVKKQDQKKKKGSIIKVKSSFNKWLLDYFGTNGKLQYFNYWGGINGAINRKLNNWNPKHEKWFKRNGLVYAHSNNEIMLPNSICGFIGSEKANDKLLENTKIFFSDLDVDLKIAWIDIDSYVNSTFDVFKLIDEAKKYDLLFLKNMTRELEYFLLDYGISQCIDYIFIFYTESEGQKIKENANKKGIDTNKTFKSKFNKEAKFFKENKVGFDLYQNLTEWKKEVNAPTRNDPEYRKMKERVRKRDSSTCACCGYHSDKKTYHNLEVHHIYGYKDHLDYRTEDSNCIILCKDCHKQYHSLYGKNNVNPVTFAYFIRDYHTYKNNNIQTTLD